MIRMFIHAGLLALALTSASLAAGRTGASNGGTVGNGASTLPGGGDAPVNPGQGSSAVPGGATNNVRSMGGEAGTGGSGSSGTTRPSASTAGMPATAPRK